MQKVFFANRTDLAVAKKSGQTNGTKLPLHMARIVAGFTEEAEAASIATAKASTVNRLTRKLLVGTPQKHRDIFGAGGCVAPLKLQGLPRSRQRTHGDTAGFGVSADEIADEKVAPMKFLQVFIGDQADKKIAARLLLFLRRELVKRFRQDFVGRSIANLLN